MADDRLKSWEVTEALRSIPKTPKGPTPTPEKLPWGTGSGIPIGVGSSMKSSKTPNYARGGSVLAYKNGGKVLPGPSFKRYRKG